MNSKGSKYRLDYYLRVLVLAAMPYCGVLACAFKDSYGSYHEHTIIPELCNLDIIPS